MSGTSGSGRGLLRWMRLRATWIAVGCSAVAVFALGLWGNLLCFGPEHTLIDVVYGTLRLFMLDDIAPEGPKPWQTELARFLAPLVSLSAILVTLLGMIRGGYRRLRLSDHAIVCGLGRKGLFLVRRFLGRGMKVVAVENDPDNAAVEACRELGAVVLRGDAADENVLRRARCARARAMVAVCGDDAVNVAVALRAHSIVRDERPGGQGARGESGPLSFHLHIGDIKCCVSFKGLGAFPDAVDRFDVIPFNFFENCARAALAANPLDEPPATADGPSPRRSGFGRAGGPGKVIGPDDPRRIHLVVAGFGQMGEAVALQAVKIGRAANLKKPRIVVIDREAAAREGSFRGRYPQIDEVAELAFREADVDDPGVRKEIASLAADGEALLTIAACIGHDMRALSWALGLPHQVRDNRVRTLVRLSEERFLDLARDRTFLSPFGETREGCDLDEGRDALARAIHEAYSSGTDIVPWGELDEGLRDSNRQQADHVPVKLRAVGCESVPSAEAPALLPSGRPEPEARRAPEGEPFSFTDAEVELLARMEHDRWCAERYLAGWRLGPKDRERKISPYLVPYDELTEDIKDYDRNAVRDIPQHLREKAGLAVRRKEA